MDAEEWAHLEARHRALEELLGAYADGELGYEETVQVEAHLAGCVRCRRALAVQRSVRSRLALEPVLPAAPAFRARLGEALAQAPEGPGAARVEGGHERRTRAVRPPYRSIIPWLGWAVAAGLAGVLLWREIPQERATSAAGIPASAGEASPIRPPMVEEALADYRRVRGAELPIEHGGVRSVQEHVPFALRPLASAEARLIGAWITEIREQPAAVLAYRWGNHVVLQYVVSEELFFRQPLVREKVAAHGSFVATDGDRSVVAWPQSGNGSLLIGDLPPSVLARLRS